jgi:hypothetical protein
LLPLHRFHFNEGDPSIAEIEDDSGGNYQTLINDALREYIRGGQLEAVVRKAVRDEVKAARKALLKTA